MYFVEILCIVKQCSLWIQYDGTSDITLSSTETLWANIHPVDYKLFWGFTSDVYVKDIR